MTRVYDWILGHGPAPDVFGHAARETISVRKTQSGSDKTDWIHFSRRHQPLGPDQSSVGRFLARIREQEPRRQAASLLASRRDRLCRARGCGSGHGVQRKDSENDSCRFQWQRDHTRDQGSNRGVLAKQTQEASLLRDYAGGCLESTLDPEARSRLTLTAPPGLAWIGWLVSRYMAAVMWLGRWMCIPTLPLPSTFPLPHGRRAVGFSEAPGGRDHRLGPCMQARLLQLGSPKIELSSQKIGPMDLPSLLFHFPGNGRCAFSTQATLDWRITSRLFAP